MWAGDRKATVEKKCTERLTGGKQKTEIGWMDRRTDGWMGRKANGFIKNLYEINFIIFVVTSSSNSDPDTGSNSTTSSTQCIPDAPQCFSETLHCLK